MTAEPEVVDLVKEDVFRDMRYTPHAGQWQVHDSTARHRVAACGRRFGKSQAGGAELVVEAYRAAVDRAYLEYANESREYWIVGPNYSDAEREFRIFYDSLHRLEFPFDRPGTYDNAKDGDMTVSLFGGRYVVHGRSAAHEKTLVGTGLDGVLMVEAAKMHRRIWTKYVRPTLLDRRGWSLHTSTPEGRDHFYELWQRGQDPGDVHWQSWRLPSWVNTVLFPEGENDPEILQSRAEMSHEEFQQEIAADFVTFVGRVFKDFDEEVHVTDVDYDPRRPVYMATDSGFRDPFVALWIQVDAFGVVRVLDEYYEAGRRIDQVVNILKTHPLSHRIDALYPEPARPDDAASIAEGLKIPHVVSGTGGELAPRLNMIRQALELGPEHAPYDQQTAHLYVDRGCRNLIREMQAYRYPEETAHRPPSEKPLDKDNHAPEALGRFFAGHLGGQRGPKRRAKVRQADMTPVGGPRRRR